MDLSNENIIHVKKDEIEYIQFKKLLEYPEIEHCFTLRKNLNFRVKEVEKIDIINNYKKLCDVLNLNYKNVIRPEQTHSKNVKNVENLNEHPSINEENYKDTDGVITNKKDIILATTSADCINLLLFDPARKVIASVHSGWKGTFNKIIVNTINKMQEIYKVDPKNIICCICPSIRKCCFEVQSDLQKPCYDIFKNEERINEIINPIGIIDGREKWKIDTVLINKIELLKLGVKQENIIDSNICSCCNKEYMYSLRGDGKIVGLNAAIISLK